MRVTRSGGVCGYHCGDLNTAIVTSAAAVVYSAGVSGGRARPPEPVWAGAHGFDLEFKNKFEIKNKKARPGLYFRPRLILCFSFNKAESPLLTEAEKCPRLAGTAPAT